MPPPQAPPCAGIRYPQPLSPSSPVPPCPQAATGPGGVSSRSRSPPPLAISAAGDAVPSVSPSPGAEQAGNSPSELVWGLSTSPSCGLGASGAEVVPSGPGGDQGHWRGSAPGYRSAPPRLPGTEPAPYGGKRVWGGTCPPPPGQRGARGGGTTHGHRWPLWETGSGIGRYRTPPGSRDAAGPAGPGRRWKRWQSKKPVRTCGSRSPSWARGTPAPRSRGGAVAVTGLWPGTGTPRPATSSACSEGGQRSCLSFPAPPQRRTGRQPAPLARQPALPPCPARRKRKEEAVLPPLSILG